MKKRDEKIRKQRESHCHLIYLSKSKLMSQNVKKMSLLLFFVLKTS